MYDVNWNHLLHQLRSAVYYIAKGGVSSPTAAAAVLDNFRGLS